MVSKENMTHIHDNGGYFLAPVPMYESYKGVFHDALNTHDYELLIGHKGSYASRMVISLIPFNPEETAYSAKHKT